MVTAERLNPGRNFKSEWLHGWGKVMGFAGEHFYKLQWSAETPKNIKRLKKHLENGSAVAYYNHICMEDSFLVLGFLLKKLGRSVRQIGGPESKKHYDFREGPMSGLLMRLARFSGVQLTPIVQHYDKEEYSDNEIFTSYLNFARAARKILEQPGGIVLIAPEGTRSPDGTLQQGQQGIGFVSKLSRQASVPVLFVPIGIIPQGQFSSGLNLHLGRSQVVEFMLNMGEPFRLDSLGKMKPEEITEVLMQRLASSLPPKMRGVYASA